MAFTERLALIISARADQAIKEIRKVTGEANQLGQKVAGTSTAAAGLGSTLKAGMAAGAAAGGAALAALGQRAIQAASALNEQQAATKQVFGSAAEGVLEFAKKAANALSISARAALQAANQFGDFFTNVGVSEQNAAKFSTQLVRLAADLGSFKDRDPTEVLQALTSGLAGETEPLRRLGVFINEAAVSAKAMELGIARSSNQVSEGAKVQARYALIVEQTSKAQGDLGRTSESLANRQRASAARLEDSLAKLGQDLVGPAAIATDAFGRVIDVAGKVGPEFLKSVPGFQLFGGLLDAATKRGKATSEAYEQLTAAQAQQAEVAENAIRAQEEFNDALKDGAEVAKLAADRRKDMLEATERAADAEIAHADANRSFENAIQDVADAERELVEARQDRTSAARDAISAERQLNSIEDATKGVADAERELAKAREGRGNTARAIADAEKSVADAQRDLNRSGGGQGGGDRRQAIERLAEARERLAEIQEEGGGQERDIADATEALSRAQLNARDAALDVAEAKEEQAERERQAGAQIKAAEESVTTARLAARSAAIDLARSTRDLVSQQAAALGQPLTLAEGYDVYRGALIKIKDEAAPGSDLRRNLEDVIKTLPPATVATTVTADVEQAKAALLGLGQLIAGIRTDTANLVGAGALEANAIGDRLASTQRGPAVLGAAPITINQVINGIGMPSGAVLEQANSTLGWTLARITRR